jgi:hypothetical protein
MGSCGRSPTSLAEQMSNEGFYFWAKKAASLQPKPAPRPEPIYAIGKTRAL